MDQIIHGNVHAAVNSAKVKSIFTVFSNMANCSLILSQTIALWFTWNGQKLRLLPHLRRKVKRSFVFFGWIARLVKMVSGVTLCGCPQWWLSCLRYSCKALFLCSILCPVNLNWRILAKICSHFLLSQINFNFWPAIFVFLGNYEFTKWPFLHK